MLYAEELPRGHAIKFVLIDQNGQIRKYFDGTEEALLGPSDQLTMPSSAIGSIMLKSIGMPNIRRLTLFCHAINDIQPITIIPMISFFICL